MISDYTIDVLDLLITLRCNARCLNCIKLCNMGDVTGLEVPPDMTLDQVDLFIRQARDAGVYMHWLSVTGGEPVLHRDLEEIVFRIKRELVDTGQVGHYFVNSNLLAEAPESVKPFIHNFVSLEDKPQRHQVVLSHPDDLGGGRPRWATCKHYRKNRVVCSVYGYNACCAADGYMRLLYLDHLFIQQFPRRLEDLPLGQMDDVCNHCPFGSPQPKFELDCGRPVSPFYLEQAELNRAGRQIGVKLGA